MSVVMGLDPSLSETGLVILDESNNIVTKHLIITKPSSGSIEYRFVFIVEEIERYIEDDMTIFIEGLAFQSKGNSAAELHALHYLIRVNLYKNNIPFYIIEPKKLKRLATGKGNCKKNLMLMKCYQKFGVEFDNDNLCDAYLLARIGNEIAQDRSGQEND